LDAYESIKNVQITKKYPEEKKTGIKQNLSTEHRAAVAQLVEHWLSIGRSWELSLRLSIQTEGFLKKKSCHTSKMPGWCLL